MQLTHHLLITGRVQGVWYRGTMCQEAERLGLTGWVRNRRDGAVEAVVQGEADALAALIEWARRGPPMARVDDVVSSVTEGNFTHFEQRPTV